MQDFEFGLPVNSSKGIKSVMLFPAATAVFRGERAGNPSAATQLPKAGLLLCCLLFSVGRLAAAEPTSEQIEFFETRIRPLLSEHCFKCHSSTSEKLKGGLLLDSHEGLLKGGDAGPVITPEAPERSKIIEAINYENPDLQMPPKGKLKQTQIKDLTKWVMDGAVWGKESPNSKTPGSVAAFDLENRRREHWAWHPIRQVAVPNPKTNRGRPLFRIVLFSRAWNKTN